MSHLSNEIKQLQQVELEILLEFKRICEKYNLTYFLVAGTLLGAVRHQGFIPWDDDVDVAMYREDFEIFKKVCKKELPKEYFLQTRETDPNYFMQIIRIRKHDTYVCENIFEHLNFHKGIYIDIFILEKMPKSDFLCDWIFKLQCALTDSVKLKLGLEVTYERTNKLRRFIFKIMQKMPLKLLYKVQDALLYFLHHLYCKCHYATLSGRHGYPREVYQKEWLEPPVTLIFEGHEFSVPAQWDKVLCNMYGDDYMKIPQKKEVHFTYFEL